LLLPALSHLPSACVSRFLLCVSRKCLFLFRSLPSSGVSLPPSRVGPFYCTSATPLPRPTPLAKASPPRRCVRLHTLYAAPPSCAHTPMRAPPRRIHVRHVPPGPRASGCRNGESLLFQVRPAARGFCSTHHCSHTAVRPRRPSLRPFGLSQRPRSRMPTWPARRPAAAGSGGQQAAGPTSAHGSSCRMHLQVTGRLVPSIPIQSHPARPSAFASSCLVLTSLRLTLRSSSTSTVSGDGRQVCRSVVAGSCPRM
jgi:hypothetical protein